LELYVMCEIPSNVICADAFADIFDGFSIGSNDLTQLTYGLDRDSGIVTGIADERHDAVKEMIRSDGDCQPSAAPAGDDIREDRDYGVIPYRWSTGAG
jgi:signal transduction protein with GAF and PtsI domain